MATGDATVRSPHVRRAWFVQTYHYFFMLLFGSLDTGDRVEQSMRGKSGNWRKVGTSFLSAVQSISFHQDLLTRRGDVALEERNTRYYLEGITMIRVSNAGKDETVSRHPY